MNSEDKAQDACRLSVGGGSSVRWRTISWTIGSASRSYTNQLVPSEETTASRGSQNTVSRRPRRWSPGMRGIGRMRPNP